MQISRISGVSPNTLHSVHCKYQEAKTVLSHQGIGNPNHPIHLREWPLEVDTQVHRKIEEWNVLDGYCDLVKLQSYLRGDHGIEMTINGIGRRLHALGFEWGPSRSMGGMSPAARVAIGVIFMKEYSLAFREEKQGRAIICYMDESFVNVRHRKRFTWFSRRSPQRNEVGGPAGKSSREIIIHHQIWSGRRLLVSQY